MRTNWFRPALMILVALITALPLAALDAAEPKCPLEIGVCLQKFELARQRPWLGLELEAAGDEGQRVRAVVSGSPAARAGVRTGDVLRKIEELKPEDWFAGKAGWKTGGTGKLVVRRAGRDRAIDVAMERMSDEAFARWVGTHMVEAHIAYLHDHEETQAR